MEQTPDVKMVQFVVEQLVEHPEDIKFDRHTDDKGVLLTLHLNTNDLGRVIGKGGVTAGAIRQLLRALGSRYDARYSLKIADLKDA